MYFIENQQKLLIRVLQGTPRALGTLAYLVAACLKLPITFLRKIFMTIFEK